MNQEVIRKTSCASGTRLKAIVNSTLDGATNRTLNCQKWTLVLLCLVTYMSGF